MFLSYATVAVFAYVILLNIFYLYSPVETSGTGVNYELCDNCLASDCYANGRPCLDTGNSSYPYICFTCDPEPTNKFLQFYTKDDCNNGCEGVGDTMQCGCDKNCYMCVPIDFDLSLLWECEIPDIPEEPTCQ
ncbi:uncharacterized protein LOC100570716 [Acyrthosiphon pisum]|uniref:ACYPI45001 protein n=1 Tax=Acyrthosiphon pisum TaxID=7029 RepID=C4WSW1_ACYPI|nr:uncharacterized protein LOC100570716 [Acyrthosiphon pisum]BAH70981.1 ACYPI45001 [Acyrthosiphon pisum]BAH70982.1 ACYPI45001 [Acyrthosiphon pisum]BAH71757.1 ACYPI45001 [Acyrthosiphon pisum]|eukprot:NP_001233001.1 uncharacterized protein LOC100570716 [Acyrthosiphon pisum]